MRLHYQKKIRPVSPYCQNSSLKNKLTIKKDHSGLHFILALLTEQNEDKIINHCRNYNIILNPLSHFTHYKDTVPKNHFVIQYGNMTIQDFQKLITVLEKINNY